MQKPLFGRPVSYIWENIGQSFLLVTAYLFLAFFFLKYPLLINSILSILSKDSKFPQYICIQFYCFVLDILLCKCSRHFLVNTMFLSPKLYSKLLNNKNHALPPTWVFFFFLYYDCIKPINLFWLNDIFTIFHISSYARGDVIFVNCELTPAIPSCSASTVQ